jgi:N-methylhydantoinase A
VVQGDRGSAIVTYVFAIDIGGTFTDLVGCDLDTGAVEFAKSSTTYGDFGRGIFDCLDKVAGDPGDAIAVKHGTTLVINALLQRSGAKTALITTRGFRDVLEIGRGNRTQPFNLRFRRDAELIPRERRYEVTERIRSNGEVLTPLVVEEIERLADALRADGIEAVAIAFINAYINPLHEDQAAELLRRLLPNVYVSTSTALSREWFEFERTATVAANAFVGPQTSKYIGKFEKDLKDRRFRGSLLLMGSHGGVLSIERARQEPIALVESGPAGGCIGATAMAGALGLENIIAFDMGGTTAKCALISNGRFTVESTYHIGGPENGFPIRGNVIDIIEVGAGGGSIASVDAQGRMHVGPRSAGSMPGPVCYAHGGTEPTVTDANLVLGRLDARNFLGGELPLAIGPAERAIVERLGVPLGLAGDERLVQSARGIITIANLTMAEAIKQISVTRGCDPRDFVLFSYGGGGPLHSADLARELNIPMVVIPPEPGNFSALGMLLADARLDRARTFLADFNAGSIVAMMQIVSENELDLKDALSNEFGAHDAAFERRIELRYKGQKHSLRIDLPEHPDATNIRRTFTESYRRRYGHAQDQAPLEIVTVVTTAVLRMRQPKLAQLLARRSGCESRGEKVRNVYDLGTKGFLPTRIFSRYELAPGFTATGPAMIEEYGSTTRIGPRDIFSIGQLGEIRIDCSR